MSHTICRFKKLTSLRAVSAAEVHNARKYQELGLPTPENIKPENEGHFGGNHYELWMEGDDMADAIQRRFNGTNILPRKDSVLAHEYVLGVSKDWYEKANYSASGMLSNLLGFIIEKYGSENIVSTAQHFDESTPHLHVIVTPVVKKERKWKNKNGSGIKTCYGLSGSDFINGRDTLRKLQDDFYNYARQWDQHDGILRRGLLSEEQSKKYTKRTNHLIGELRDLTSTIKSLTENIKAGLNVKESTEKLFEKESQYDQLLEKLEGQQSQLGQAEKRTKYRKEKNKNGGWKKGLNF